MQSFHFSLLEIAATISGVLSYEICATYSSYYTYCEDGYYCCYNDTQCCPDVSNVSIGTIIGIVIGSLFFLSCCICVICLAVKKNHRPGRIIRPAQQQRVAVVTSGQTMYGQPSYSQPPFGHPQRVYRQRQENRNGGSSLPPPAY